MTFEQMNEEEKKVFMTKVMDDANKEFKENPIDPKNDNLSKLVSKLKVTGFNFDPKEICKEIDIEAKKQFSQLCQLALSGLNPNTLADIKNEVIAWFNSEEVRFESFRDFKIAEAKGLLNSAKLPDNIVKLKEHELSHVTKLRQKKK